MSPTSGAVTDESCIGVARLELGTPARLVWVSPASSRLLLVVTLGGQVLGHVELEREVVDDDDALLRAIAAALGDRLWLNALRGAIARAARGPDAARRAGRPLSASVVVQSASRPERLSACLQSLDGLASGPTEVTVVEHGAPDPRRREACERYGARLVRPVGHGGLEDLRSSLAEGSVDVVAFTRESCTVDHRWLDHLGHAFFDPLVMAVVGYVGPSRLETPAQQLYERHAGFDRAAEARVVDGASSLFPVCAAAGVRSAGNILFRREILESVALPLGDPSAHGGSTPELYALYGVLRAGWRVALDPSRIAWHEHPRDEAGVVRALGAAAASRSAYAVLCLVRHGELGGLRVLGAAWAGHARDLRRAVRRRSKAVKPASLVVAEAAGTARGPLSLVRDRRRWRASWQRAAVTPIRTAARDSTAGNGGQPGRLSVVVPSFNRAELLLRVLEGLDHQRYLREGYVVVVVIDGSTDCSAELVCSLRPGYS